MGKKGSALGGFMAILVVLLSVYMFLKRYWWIFVAIIVVLVLLYLFSDQIEKTARKILGLPEKKKEEKEEIKQIFVDEEHRKRY